MFVARYMLCILPAQALLVAWFLRGILPRGGRRAVLAGYLVIMLLGRAVAALRTRPFAQHAGRRASAGVCLRPLASIMETDILAV